MAIEKKSAYGVEFAGSPLNKKKALYLSYFTVGYNIFECLASIFAGALAGSIALISFGLDSSMESLSGSVMIWRFTKHEQLSKEEEERKEKMAVKLISGTFIVLAAYVFFESVKKLYYQEVPSPSLVGIIIAILSLIVMPVLFYWKKRTGKLIQSNSLMADAKQTLACIFLSAALLIGLILNYLLGFWQADPLVGLLTGFFLAREGFVTIKESTLCEC